LFETNRFRKFVSELSGGSSFAMDSGEGPAQESGCDEPRTPILPYARTMSRESLSSADGAFSPSMKEDVRGGESDIEREAALRKVARKHFASSFGLQVDRPRQTVRPASYENGAQAEEDGEMRLQPSVVQRFLDEVRAWRTWTLDPTLSQKQICGQKSQKLAVYKDICSLRSLYFCMLTF
jgi:hypothetical protein